MNDPARVARVATTRLAPAVLDTLVRLSRGQSAAEVAAQRPASRFRVLRQANLGLRRLREELASGERRRG